MTAPTHSPAPWIYDAQACAIRYQLPAGHPDRYDSEDDGWRNVVSLVSACGGVDGNTDVELMTAAPALLAALRALLPYAESRIEDMNEAERDAYNHQPASIWAEAKAATRKAEVALANARSAISAATTAVRHG